MSKEKRTFWQFLDRTVQLDFRMIRLRIKFRMLEQFHPIRALFVRKRFNKTLKALHTMKINEYKKGYSL